MSWQIVIASLFAVGLIYLFLQVIYYPVKLTTKILLNVLIGAIVLIIINLLGSFFEYSLPINHLTVLTIGFLGIPGIILLVILKFIIL